MQTKSKFLLAFWALWLIMSTAVAQQYTLSQVLEVSEKNYPLLKARSAEVESARHEAKSISAEYIPRVSVQHQYTYGTSNSVAGSFYPNPAVISPSGGIRADNSSPATWGSYTSALLEWNVFNFGKVRSQQKTARTNVSCAEAAYDNEVFQHQIRVIDNYLLTLMTDKLVAVQEQNLKRATQFRHAVDAGVNSGLRPGVDSSLAHVEYIRATIQLLQVERDQKAQHLRLLELTGLSGDTTTGVDSMRFYARVPQLIASNHTENWQHPLLHFYRTRIDFFNQKSIVTRRSFLPSVTLVGALWARGSGVSNTDNSFYTDFKNGTEYQVNNYLVGIATRWVISDFFSTHQRYKADHFRALREQELFNEQNLKLKRQQDETSVNYEVALKQVQAAPLQLQAARQAYEQASARYRSGLTDLPTLLQSMVSLTQAEVDHAVAYCNVWRSLLAVAAAQGDLSLFTNAAQ